MYWTHLRLDLVVELYRLLTNTSRRGSTGRKTYVEQPVRVGHNLPV